MRSSTMNTKIFAVIHGVRGMVGKMAAAWVLCALATCSLWGCAGKDARGERTVSGFAFDTTYSITAFRGGSQEVLDGCISKCGEYERIFSRTSPDSEVYQVNEIERLYEQFREEEAIRENRSEKNRLDFQIREDGSLACGISRELHDILEKGLHYGRVSQGAFDITIAPVSSLWDFKGEKKGVPGRERIRDAVGKVSYEKISLEEGAVVFKEPGMALDLGGIAKGYIADGLKEYLVENGVESGIINLGGNVLCIGKKPGGDSFRIGIQQPFADRNETVAAIQAEDLSVVSSGIYERYFQDGEGRLYHHILNPKTGYPYDNDLMGVTILSESSVDGDGLSTTCFSLGLEKGMDFIDSMEGVEALFITRDETLHHSQGWDDFLQK